MPDTPNSPHPGAVPLDPDACEACEPKKNRPGPTREGGGTTGAGNLSPDQANRTGGATGGVDDNAQPAAPPRRGVEPDA